MRITALDLGATTGVCYGEAGEAPRFETWKLDGATLGARGVDLLFRLGQHLEIEDAEKVYIEEPMRLAAMMDRGATIDTLLGLYGYTALALTSCAGRGVPTTLVGVQRCRKHFLGFFPKKGQGKPLVLDRCRVLGWTPTNNNESDAAAVWDLACALESPAAQLRAKLRQSVALS